MHGPGGDLWACDDCVEVAKRDWCRSLASVATLPPWVWTETWTVSDELWTRTVAAVMGDA